MTGAGSDEPGDEEVDLEADSTVPGTPRKMVWVGACVAVAVLVLAGAALALRGDGSDETQASGSKRGSSESVTTRRSTTTTAAQASTSTTLPSADPGVPAVDSTSTTGPRQTTTTRPGGGVPPPPPPPTDPPPPTADPRAMSGDKSFSCPSMGGGSFHASMTVHWSDGYVESASFHYTDVGDFQLTGNRKSSVLVKISDAEGGRVCANGGFSGPVYWPE